MNRALLLGGSLSILAGLLHFAIIIGGANWYRFFGAGERLTKMAEQGSPLPDLLTAGIALLLFVWGLYAFSGAGLTRPLPWLKSVLIAISSIYLLRGLAVIPALLFTAQTVDAFIIWSSAISTMFGFSYAVGTRQMIWELS